MITSIQQKNRALAKVEQLRSRQQAPTKPGVPDHVLEMEAAQLAEDIELLESDVAEYEAACSAHLQSYSFTSYQDFLKFPIVIRLARGLSQQEFAEQVGISLSQLKRYEAQDYQNAPNQIVNTVLERFGLDYRGHVSHAS